MENLLEEDNKVDNLPNYDERKAQLAIMKKMIKLEKNNVVPLLTHMVMLSFFYKGE